MLVFMLIQPSFLCNVRGEYASQSIALFAPLIAGDSSASEGGFRGKFHAVVY
jgi:hypothetical protein